jgi:hypothetical protein
MSLTMGTCPVRGGSALIKCADPNCKAYINQVPSSAHTLLPSSCFAAVGTCAIPRCCVEASACIQCANACCRGLTRARRIRRTSTTHSCAMSALQSPSAAMARGCAGACRASSTVLPAANPSTLLTLPRSASVHVQQSCQGARVAVI